LMRMTNNVERIGDSVENLAQLMEGIADKELHFTEAAKEDIGDISGKVIDFLHLVTDGMQQYNDRTFMKEADAIEDAIDSMRENMRDGHISRLRTGECAIDPGLVYIGMLAHFEKIGDYCYNIAEAVAGLK